MDALTPDNDHVDLERGQATFKDGSKGRVYVPSESLPQPSESDQYPSTTTCKKLIKNREKEARLQQWRGKFESPEDVLGWYQARGEIAHEKTYEFLAEHLGLEYEADFSVALDKLRDIEFDEFPLAETNNYKKYAMKSGMIAAREMAKWLLNDIKEVIAIEQYVLNTDVGFAGQFDLLYLSQENELVLTDLKTSRSLWQGYYYQTSAYYHTLPRQELIEEVEEEYGIEVTDFRCRVIRSHYESEQDEDSSEVVTHTDADWRRDTQHYYNVLSSAAHSFQNEKLPVQDLHFTE